MATCLVTGGNGFLGSFVVDQLVSKGHRVRVFDRFSGPQRYEAHGVERIAADYRDELSMRAAVRGADHVYHFLATTNPVSSERDPLTDLDNDVRPTVDLLRMCVEYDVQHFHFASTGGAIYGTTAHAAVDENHPTRPVSPYGIGKLAIEGYVRYFSRLSSLRSTVFRISNPYGPRQSPFRQQGVIPVFLRRALAGEPLVVYGDGSSVRDYVFVEDAAAMIVTASQGNPESDVYNIGSGVGLSVTELINLIAEKIEHGVAVEYRDSRQTAVDRIVLDTGRFAEEFGSPDSRVPLNEGLERTISHLHEWTELRA